MPRSRRHIYVARAAASGLSCVVAFGVCVSAFAQTRSSQFVVAPELLCAGSDVTPVSCANAWRVAPVYRRSAPPNRAWVFRTRVDIPVSDSIRLPTRPTTSSPWWVRRLGILRDEAGDGSPNDRGAPMANAFVNTPTLQTQTEQTLLSLVSLVTGAKGVRRVRPEPPDVSRSLARLDIEELETAHLRGTLPELEESVDRSTAELVSLPAMSLGAGVATSALALRAADPEWYSRLPLTIDARVWPPGIVARAVFR